MESIFRKEPPNRAATVYDKIAPEILHLDKVGGVRKKKKKDAKEISSWVGTIAFFLVLTLYFMDPLLYSWHKSDAIRSYLYLRTYNDSKTLQEVAASGILTPAEVSRLDERHGSFQDYFTNQAQAEQTAASAVSFMSGMRDLHYGRYDELDPIGKLRYLLFVKIGLHPPETWGELNPSVD